MSIPNIDDLYKWLAAAPAYLLVVIACVILGLVLKAIRGFPNSAIPAVVVLSGGICQLLLAGEEPGGTSHRAWLVRNLLIGLILAFVAWGLHRTVIKKLETKIPWLGNLLHTGNTDQFTNPNPKQDLTPHSDSPNTQDTGQKPANPS